MVPRGDRTTFFSRLACWRGIHQPDNTRTRPTCRASVGAVSVVRLTGLAESRGRASEGGLRDRNGAGVLGAHPRCPSRHGLRKDLLRSAVPPPSAKEKTAVCVHGYAHGPAHLCPLLVAPVLAGQLGQARATNLPLLAPPHPCPRSGAGCHLRPGPPSPAPQPVALGRGARGGTMFNLGGRGAHVLRVPHRSAHSSVGQARAARRVARP
jgi:hypothetical protein